MPEQPSKKHHQRGRHRSRIRTLYKDSVPRTQSSHAAPQSKGAGRPAHKRRRSGGGRPSRMRPPKSRSIREVKSVTVEKRDTIPPLAPGNIRIIPLGGVEEVGKNMTLVEIGNDIIVIDAGFQFGEAETPGIDYLLPNTKYLEERRDKIRALFITHGHLDHIGGIPYIIEKLGFPPVYSKEFGAIMIQKRQDEFPHMRKLDIRILKDKQKIKVGDLTVETVDISHAIPDSMGVIINTPHGDLVIIKDVRIDHKSGEPTKEEVDRYARFKDRNVLFFTLDSTRVETPGWSLPERDAIETIDRIMKEVKGRLIIATFASQVERIMQFIKAAEKYNKKLVIDGRSMKTNVEIIKQLKLIDIKHAIPIEDIEKYSPDKVVVLVTGGQGEEFASLARAANKTHKYLRLNKNDTIILSSSIIPGNEGAITRMKDNLYRSEARVITYLSDKVHSGGHGYRGELEWIHTQIPYKFFMPLHGHHYMLRIHQELSESLGTPRHNIVVPDNGTIIEIHENGTKLVTLKERAPSDSSMVDGFTVSGGQEVVIRDRQMLAEDGIFIVVASVDPRSGKLRKSPDIVSRGFIYLREEQQLLDETRAIIKRTVEHLAKGTRPIDFDYIKSEVTNEVRKHLFQRTAKSPMVIPVIIGV